MNIGLDSVYYSKITEGTNGVEAYGTPKKFSKALTANMNINRLKTKFFADDELDEIFDEFIEGTLGMNLKDILSEAVQDLFGAKIDANGVVVMSKEDSPKPVAIGFRSKIKEGLYEYVWLYRVLFSPPNRSFNTKGEQITINTPTVEGTIMQRRKPDYNNDHPWETHLVDDGSGTHDTAINAWFTSVYEPSAPAAQTAAPAAQGNG